MRGMNFNVGLRGVLFEASHFEKMGTAIWLYGWLALRQTHQCDGFGWVLGGAPVNYREIEEETGFNRRTLERWMRTLREHGYVLTQAAPSGIVIRITRPKKFPQTRALFHRDTKSRTDRVAEAVRELADGRPQSSVAMQSELFSNHTVASRISSSSIEREIEKQTPFPLKERQKPQDENFASSGNTAMMRPADFLREARLRLQLLRAEREDAVRRELAVGGGPEVRRS